MVLLSLIKFTPLTRELLSEFLATLLPGSVLPMVENVMDELYQRATAILSVSVIVAIWSSAKGVMALTNGFNIVYNVEETRNYFMVRLRSAAYTIAFVLAIALSLVLLVFGKDINELVKIHLPVIASVIEQIFGMRVLMAFAAQLLIFMLLYRFIPNRKIRMRWQLPGAIFSSIGWNIFSFFFGIYVQYGNMSYMYGSLTTLIVVMLWIYICVYIIFIGAELNAFVERLAFVKRKELCCQEKKNRKRERKKVDIMN